MSVRKILEVKTLYFARPFDFTAGQYIMVFIDGSVKVAYAFVTLMMSHVDYCEECW